jgi:hypothetical protein
MIVDFAIVKVIMVPFVHNIRSYILNILLTTLICIKTPYMDTVGIIHIFIFSIICTTFMACRFSL